MGRDDHNKSRGKNKHKLPQVPKNMKSDGKDIEFSKELADHDDMEAMERMDAADQRAQNK